VTLANIVGGAVVIGASYFFVAQGEARLEARQTAPAVREIVGPSELARQR
jgi:hypothetical protein